MLVLNDVSVRLGRVEILRGVTLKAPAGVVVGLLGRNGAGKTTLVRAVMGLVPLAHGIIELDGMRLDQLSPHERARLGIGYMPEDRRLIPHWTVEENLMLPVWASNQSDGPKRLARVFELVEELARWRKRRTLELSGGQQKIVALGRALMSAQKLLLLDEPFEGVAPALGNRISQVISGLKGEHSMAVLVTDSNESYLNALAEQLYAIERGVVAPSPHPPKFSANPSAP